MTSASLEFPLANLPTRLLDLIRQNRERVSVGLATEAEAQALIGNVEPSKPIKAHIDRWHMVAIRIRDTGQASFHLVGWTSLFNSLVTSDVVVLDRDRARVETLNSTYQLGEPQTGEPDLHLVGQVAHALRVWGINRRYSLGVPRLD